MQKKHKRVAAIDVGSNSLHLVIAKISTNWADFQVIEKLKAQVRLGHGGGKFSFLLDEAIADGVRAMKEFARIAREHDVLAVRAVATSAVREAENKDVFIEQVRKTSGIDIEVVSGYEESRLIFLGACRALGLHNEKIALCDIGGGSAELIAANKGELVYASSFKIGAIRMTEKFFQNKEFPQSEAVAACKEFVENEIFEAVQQLKKNGFNKFVGTSGTIQTLANMALYATKDLAKPKPSENLNNVTVKKNALDLVVKNILEADQIQRISKLPGIDSKRADIITAGAITYQTILNALDVKEFVISSYALREGILIDYIERQRSESPSEAEGYHLGTERLNSILLVGKKYDFLEPHATHVKNLALMIYDNLSDIHKLPVQARAYLEAASLLHDVGFFVSKSSHHKHSLYIIQNSEIFGFTENELAIIANTARYHRKSHPKASHNEFNKLTAAEKEIVLKLASILRIAEALDRSHNSLVSNIKTTFDSKKINFELTAKYDISDNAQQLLHLELWSFDRRKGLLEETYSRSVSYSIA